jgi:hypothetical protein
MSQAHFLRTRDAANGDIGVNTISVSPVAAASGGDMSLRGGTESIPTGRRSFLKRAAAGAGFAFASGATQSFATTTFDPSSLTRRRQRAYQIRIDAAELAASRPQPSHPNNGEEALYPKKIASFSKGLPHNNLGEVDPTAYAALKAAIISENPADFEAVPLGYGRKLTNPQSAYAYDLEGADSHDLAQPPAPTIARGEAASELDELYWMALARDIAFADYASDPTIAAASAELTGFNAFRGPRDGGAVTPGTVFRGITSGDLIGPYVSQFLWMDIPMGAVLMPQQMRSCVANVDYMTEYDTWLAIQNGFTPAGDVLEQTPRYICKLRDLARWVHVDALYQAYHQACLILMGMNAPADPGNPYVASVTQEGFGTFGGPHILSLVTEVATRALKAVWYQKWRVHRRLRPEAFAGLVHNVRSGAASYPVSAAILNAPVLDRIRAAHGSYLLPQAFPEGSPLHPSYGAGHATVAGACVTILKAFFDESFVLPNPVVTDRTGSALLPYSGPDLTVGNELNKLAANVAIARNGAGVHYRSDYTQSILLGEAIALSILEEQREVYNESNKFTVTTFDGTTVEI